MTDHFVAVAHLPDLALVDPDGGVAELLNVEHGVTAEHHGFLLGAKLVHALDALALKRHVAHRQRFIDDQDIRPHHGGNGKCQPHVHA